MELLVNFILLLVPAVAVILTYALKRANKFNFTVWFSQNRDRFILCGLTVLVLAVGLTFIKGFDEVFTIVGLGKSKLSLPFIGGSLGGFTVAGMRSRK